MDNDRQSKSGPDARGDVTRSGAIAVVWVLFYVLLAAYAGFWANDTPKLAQDIGAASAALAERPAR